MKVLNNVLIKLIRGGFTDRVLYIDNVPEEMFYEMQYPRICVGKGLEQHYEPDMSKEKIPTLYPELSLSQTGDKGIVFDLDNEHGKNRYLALDRYLKQVYPSNKLPAEPMVNSTDPMDSGAAALQLSQIPRVVLPALSPSESQDSVAGEATAAGFDVEEIKRKAVEEYKAQENAEVKERMEKARAARSVKQKA